MKKILFITNRNALTTCGALRLIKNRAEALFEDYGIASDFVVLQRNDRINSPKREPISAGGNMTIVGYDRRNYYGALNKLKSEIINILKKNTYDAIIISQIALKINIVSIKEFTDAPIFLDIHGAPDDIYGSVNKASVLPYLYRRLIASYYIKCLKYYCKKVDGCLVVSHGLEEYIRNRFMLKDGFVFYRVPCALSTELNISDYKDFRNAYRREFELDEKDISFVYSGGLEPWQCINETIELYKKIADSIKASTKMMIFSYEIEKLRTMLGTDNRFVLRSYKSDELSKALCACDYAFLIREDITTNHVAFPNKFLEYVKSYLKIIATAHVHDVADQINLYKLGFITDLNNVDTLCSYIQASKDLSISPETIKEVLKINSFKVRLKEFAEQIG